MNFEALIKQLADTTRAITATPEFAALDLDDKTDFIFAIRQAVLYLGDDVEEALAENEEELFEAWSKEQEAVA